MTDEAWGERLAGLEEVTLDGGLTLIVARTFRERRRGLAKMTPLPAGYGLRILKCNSIHTIGMLFSFDVVMIDKDFRVVSTTEMVKPFRLILPKRRAESVIELPAHAIFRSRTEVGDQLLIERYESKKVPQPLSQTKLGQTAIGSEPPVLSKPGAAAREIV